MDFCGVFKENINLAPVLKMSSIWDDDKSVLWVDYFKNKLKLGLHCRNINLEAGFQNFKD